MIHYAVNRDAVLLRTGRQREAAAGHRRRRAADLERPEDDHGQAQEGHQVRPAGQPRDHLEGHQVRLRARVQLARALALRHGLLRRHRRRADQARRDQGHPGHRDARRLDHRLQAQGAERGARLPGAGHADLHAGAAGVRQASSTPRRRRPTTSTSSSPARTCTRTTLGQARRAHAGQAASSSCATPTGIRRPTTAPPTWTRSRSRRATTTRSPRRGAILKGSALVQGDGTTPGAGHQAGALAQQGPDRLHPRRRLPHRSR